VLGFLDSTQCARFVYENSIYWYNGEYISLNDSEVINERTLNKNDFIADYISLCSNKGNLTHNNIVEEKIIHLNNMLFGDNSNILTNSWNIPNNSVVTSNNSRNLLDDIRTSSDNILKSAPSILKNTNNLSLDYIPIPPVKLIKQVNKFDYVF